MNDTLKELYDVIEGRKKNSGKGSYTSYLFEQGLDKILKKIGEESSEVIIASKNTESDAQSGKDELVNEICDLLYHILVLMADRNISIDQVDAVLEVRRQKSGNLKEMKKVDKNT